MKPRHQIIYKKVKAFEPFCSKCEEILIESPDFEYKYVCRCGKWKYDFENLRYRVVRK